MEYKDGHVILDDSWKCTDVDNYQFCKVLGDTEFSYCQLANDDIIRVIESLTSVGHLTNVKEIINNLHTSEEDWYSGDIDVNDYDADEIGYVLSAYTGILDNVNDELLRNQLIAECIFETYMFTDFNNNYNP